MMAAGLLIAWGICVGVLTLRPTSMVGALSLEDFLCVWCSTRPAVDKILNLLMFVPGGVALGALVGMRRTILIGAALTIGIEALQMAIPGRHPSLADIVLNTAGAAAGAWLHRTGPSPGLLRACGVAAAVAWLAPSVLLAPTPRDSQLYAIWTPEFGGQPTYSGEVLGAELDGIDLRYRLEESDAARAALSRRGTLELEFVVGRQPAEPTYVFGLWDAEQNPNFTVTAHGTDLLVGWWSPARTLGLDHPPLTARDALAGRAVGDTVRVVVEHADGRWCVAVDAARDCSVSPGLKDGWALLLDASRLTPGSRKVLGAVWTLLVGVLVTVPLWSVRAAVAVGVWVSVYGAGLVAAGASPELEIDAWSVVPLGLGVLVGFRLGKLMLARSQRARSGS